MIIKYFFACLLFLGSTCYGQLTMDQIRSVTRDSGLGSYSYHEEFLGHAGYGAPGILTSDGGGAIFGDFEDDNGPCALLMKLDKNGAVEWRQTIKPDFDEMEAQSVVQDGDGNYYVFMLSYNHEKYRGGSERIIHLDSWGAILWDKTIGTHSQVNNPIVSYIRMLEDGRVYMRGHVTTEEPADGEDPDSRYWEGWLDNKGELTQKAGEVIDWANEDWKKWYMPE